MENQAENYGKVEKENMKKDLLGKSGKKTRSVERVNLLNQGVKVGKHKARSMGEKEEEQKGKAIEIYHKRNWLPSGSMI